MDFVEGLTSLYRSAEDTMDAGLEALMVFVSALGGSAVTAFWKKKAENYATKQDVADLTEITKRVEAKISNEVWDRQKKWELKREVLFEAMRRLADIEEVLNTINAILQVELKESKEGDIAWMETKIEASASWRKASANFDETKLFVSVTCGTETKDAFSEYGKVALAISMAIAKGTANAYDTLRPNLVLGHIAVRAAVRNELGVEAL
jgi:hypothetical protein